jgi:NADPH2:quinone reductase
MLARKEVHVRAWLLDRFEGLSALGLADVPDPAPGPGEVVLQVAYAGLNPADRYLSEGQYPAKPPLPHILGRDAMGEVVRVGPDVRDLKVGDRRMLLRGEAGVSRAGTFADRVAVPAQTLVEIPPGWSDEEASGATLVDLTAYQALTQWGDLVPGVVLVTGASGGVGVASVQLARAMGHRVVALSRSAEKSKRLRELGAAIVLDPQDASWRKRLKDELEGARVDLAIDNIGGALFSQIIDTLGEHGKVSVVGRLAGPVPQFNTASLFFRRIRIGGVAVGTYSNPESRAAWTHIVQLMSARGVRPIVDSVYAFEDLPQAFARLSEGPMGKVLLKVKGA